MRRWPGRWAGTPAWVLAAPCCHHDLAAQLRASGAGAVRGATRHGILRERFADVLTDALRAALLRLHGYRVEVVEFVDSAHTPRNLLLRARTPARTNRQRAEYGALTSQWGVTPGVGRSCSPDRRVVKAAVCTLPATWKSKNIR